VGRHGVSSRIANDALITDIIPDAGVPTSVDIAVQNELIFHMTVSRLM
jgi:hypothetical protein